MKYLLFDLRVHEVKIRKFSSRLMIYVQSLNHTGKIEYSKPLSEINSWHINPKTDMLQIEEKERLTC